jgi:hypothetical protein
LSRPHRAGDRGWPVGNQGFALAWYGACLRHAGRHHRVFKARVKDSTLSKGKGPGLWRQKVDQPERQEEAYCGQPPSFPQKDAQQAGQPAGKQRD